MKLTLTPMDTFYFGNHKSLIPGVDHFAEGLFPPRPTTIYGALRSAYIHALSDFSTFLAGTDGELKKWMGTASTYGQLELKGTFWEDETDLVLPLPSDHQVIRRDEANYIAKRLKLVKEEAAKDWGSDLSSHRLYGVSKEKSVSSRGRYIYKQDFIKSLVEPADLPTLSLTEWLDAEQTMGIGHDRRTRQAQEGMLYSMKMLRFKDNRTSMVAFAKKAPDFSQVNIVTLGARQRPWRLKASEKRFTLGIDTKLLIKAIEKTGIARLILLTPAIWKHGNRPACWDKEKNALIVDETEYPILTTAMSRPSLEGGWDMVRHRPKPRRNSVPAGSVLYLTVPRGKAENLVYVLHETNFSDELDQLGYGLTVIGCGLIN